MFHLLIICTRPLSVQLALALTFGLALMSQRQMVWSSEALNKCPFSELFHERP